MFYSDRWYQTEAVWSFFNWFETYNAGHPIIAMPTATGKSVVIAKIIKEIFWRDQNQRVLMLTHVKDLISQNAQKLLDIWPTAPLGIYSAGLKQRDMVMPIIFAGVQSVSKAIARELAINDLKPDTYKHFGRRHIVIIDECHLLSPDDEAQYQYVIRELMRINPGLVVVGLSATPWRQKGGELINKGGLFTHVCYDITNTAAFNRLIAEGYLANMIAKPTATQIDLSSLGLTKDHDFNQAQAEKIIDTDETIFAAVRESISYGHDRRAWLTFTAGVDSAEHVASVMQGFGVNALAVHSKLPAKVNDERLAMYKAGELQSLVSTNKLTTGIDHPPIDLIIDLQPTTASAKQVQKGGRGMRPSPETGKLNCLFLDFCGNIPRCGPINDPKVPGAPKKGGGDMPVKICDRCGVYNAAAARECFNCQFVFTFESVIFGTAGTTAILKDDAPIVERFAVIKVLYALHEKRNKQGILISPPSIRVSYFAGLRMFQEWVCLEHKGLPLHRAHQWWRQRIGGEPPITTHQALQLIQAARWPTYINVHVNREYPEILNYEF